VSHQYAPGGRKNLLAEIRKLAAARLRALCSSVLSDALQCARNVTHPSGRVWITEGACRRFKLTSFMTNNDTV
jgi:hypothetical protein